MNCKFYSFYSQEDSSGHQYQVTMLGITWYWIKKKISGISRAYCLH